MKQKINDKYQVLKKLGEGFGGSVFLVKGDNSAEVALKQLRMRDEYEVLSPKETLENFKEEFTTLKKLTHPHILRILDFGYDPSESFYYFTTEYIEGQDIFEATRGLPYSQIEELFVQILRALSYLHRRNIYHFDIKPPNILVGTGTHGDRTAKLIDFGLAAFRKKGVLAGSPGYIAPEALLSDGVRDGRADLYSLGVTWYTCLYGKNPFEGKNLQETLTLHKVWTAPPISNQCTGVPSYLDPILEKLLKKNPAERYHHADQVIRDLNWSGHCHYPLETDATALAYLPGEGQLVGRDAEWSELLHHFDRVFFSRKESQDLLLLTGAAGTGKTRLLNELKYYAQLNIIPVLDLVTSSQDDVSSDCLVIADNANADTIELAKRWMQRFHTYSILIVLAGSELPKSPDIGTQIVLKNLDRSSVRDYVASVLGENNPPDFLIEEILSRTEGNPRFLTELLQSLIESHQIFDEQGRWSTSLLQELGIDFGKLHAPHTLTEYCHSKYDPLPDTTRNLLSLIILAKAPLDRALLSKLGYGIQKQDLDRLQQDNLVFLHPETNEIRLLNPSFQDWLPKTLEPTKLSEFHQLLGEIFCQDTKYEEASWYHLGLGTGDEPSRFQKLFQYGQSLLEHCRWAEAITIFDIAEKISTIAERQVRASLKKVESYSRLGQHSEALKLLGETQKILKREKENPEHWRWVERTYRDMGSMYLKAGQFPQARESLQSSQILLEEHEDNIQEEMIIKNLKASLLMREGMLSEAARISEQTYEDWKNLPMEIKKEVLNNELPIIYMAQGRFTEARILFQEQHSFSETIGNLTRQAHAIYGWAQACHLLNERDEAKRHYQSCVEISRKIKNKELLFHAFNGLGNLAFLSQEWSQAEQHYQNALELAQHHEDINSAVGIAINLAHVLRLDGDYGRAKLYLDHVIDTLIIQPHASMHQLQFLTQAYIEMGRLHLNTAHWIEARDAFRDANSLIRTHTLLEHLSFDVRIGFAQAAFHLNREPEAREIITELEKRPLSAEESHILESVKEASRHS